MHTSKVKHHMANLKQNNDMAVSPIVATLVLIVVAVIGAVAVGTIMGTFSSDVSKNANTGSVAGASNTEVLVSGSTTLQPVIALAASNYTAGHPGIKITVQGGGSGAGLAGVVQQVTDIGMMSEDMTAAQKTAYPNIKQFQLGADGVVVVSGSGSTLKDATTADLYTIFSTGAAPASGNLSTVTAAYGRSDKSGTADSFGAFIGMTLDQIYTPVGFYKTASGNGGIVTAIKGDLAPTTAIGFVDYDYAVVNNLKVVNYLGATAAPTEGDIKDAWNNKAGAKFPHGATRGLFFVTNGAPSSVTGDFITYCQSPATKTLFNNAYMVHDSELVVS